MRSEEKGSAGSHERALSVVGAQKSYLIRAESEPEERRGRKKEGGGEEKGLEITGR